ncbi:P-loop containing nucleoside triphosphate hydrolase protein [Aspergillus ellipticus CBS 707.79]|uniref:P-loop containing nucleoside triphosphate hydrolase protein n=1 Tax=Aspergillus ellipticus CBS 707.79 TaxID=1448320 RepID=A0A319ENN4_9EURO|nr:P-loop containing nucleoside triphosphate hydrolase protein [Aspergillus ellipticus CBS 707.79]
MTNQSIIATCKQTRFHLHDKASKEVDVKGLTIAVSSISNEDNVTKSKSKGKSKAKADARELITDAHLRLKEGVCYGLIGRNGTGKSTLLRAMADKLVPGIPHATRIAILQQTDTATQSSLDTPDSDTDASDRKGKPVLEYVLSSDDHKNEVAQKMDLLSRSFESDDPLQPVRAIRAVRHRDTEKDLFLAQKMAHLKSGARGLQARKELKSAESKLENSLELLNQTKETIDAEIIQEDTKAAMEALQDLQSQFEAMRVTDTEQQARQILAGLGFQEAMLNKPFLKLSGGWRMRCMLARVIWLEKYLQQLRESSQTTILMVSHDRDFVNAVCEEVIILREQKLAYSKGNLSAYEKDFEEQKLYWGRMKEAQERQIAHMEATVRDNIKIGKKTNDDNKLRMAKSRQKKIDDRMGVQVSATGGRFKLNRDLVGYHLTARAEIEVPTDERGATMALPDATELRFPGPLVSLEGVVYRYDLRGSPVLNGVELVLHMGDRVGLMGLNGCGKSTLVRLLAGNTLPTQGKISTHSRMKLGYYAQHSIEELQERGWLDPGLTALGLLSEDVNGSLNEGELRGLLAPLGLQGRVVSDVPIHRLSGGQLVRLSLARVVWNSPHLLILDEVTTHLDFYTVTAISSALSRFNGAILVVSHDRFLIRSVVEGKRDSEQGVDEEFEGVDNEPTEVSGRRRVVYVLKAGKLNVQENGAEQFEQSLARKVGKMLPVAG